jgi:hypothetical protein
MLSVVKDDNVQRKQVSRILILPASFHRIAGTLELLQQTGQVYTKFVNGNKESKKQPVIYMQSKKIHNVVLMSKF